MIDFVVFIFTSRYLLSRYIFRNLVNLAKFLQRRDIQILNFDEKRFERANWISSSIDRKAGQKDKSIELIVVSTSKDFDILVHSVNYAIKSLSEYRFGGVRIIVPKRDLDECRRLFARNNGKVKIIDETTIISSDQINLLSQNFGNRDTWILQQLLKVQAVLTTSADAVLILDSDTLLLRKRPWFDQQGRQILTPSFEFNPPYYVFLNKLIFSKVIPDYTFVSHHMIIQPKILNQIMIQINTPDINKFLEYCCLHSDKYSSSPICVEYELYGQYVALKESQSVFYARWANATIPKKYSGLILNSKILRFIISHSFNSISFHSWS